MKEDRGTMRTTRLAAAAAAALLAAAVLSVAGPAWADDTTSSLAPCTPATSTSTVVPLYTAKCAPLVSGSIGGQITVTLPGVGSVTFKTTAGGTIDTSTQPSVSVIGQNFSGGTPVVSADGTHITVAFVNIAKPAQHYTIKVKISPPTSAGGVPTIKAVAGPTGKHHHHHGDDGNKGEAEDKQGARDPDDDGGQGINPGQQGPLAPVGGAPGGHSGDSGD
jgi:hypothetical protein